MTQILKTKILYSIDKDMKEYVIDDFRNFCDVAEEIKNSTVKKAAIILKNDACHCRTLKFLYHKEINVTGINKPEYEIYIGVRELRFYPWWCFEHTNFDFRDNNDIYFSNLHFTYFIEDNDVNGISYEYDEKINKYREIIDMENVQIVNPFTVPLMRFDNSEIVFKDCLFENNSNTTFDISAKKHSKVIFENCVFQGDFNFNIDVSSSIIIQ